MDSIDVFDASTIPIHRMAYYPLVMEYRVPLIVSSLAMVALKRDFPATFELVANNLSPTQDW